MKIAFTIDIVGRGGKERQLLLLTRELVARGHDVRILSIYKTPIDYIHEYGISGDRISVITDKKLLKKFKQETEFLMCFRPDLVFAWDPISALFALLRRKRLGCSFINGSIQHGIWLFRFRFIFRTLIAHMSPYVVANSRAGLKANFLKFGKKRMVLNNGIEDKFINRLSKDDIARRRDALLPGFAERPGKIFISVANLLPFKDYFTVLDAMAIFRETADFYYLILGDGPLLTDIENRIRRNKLQDRVFLLGKIEEVSDYLHVSDCMIHSSRGEGISNSILEGMRAGLPIIATNVGGVPETVYPESSLLFPYKDKDALLRCLRKVDELITSFDPRSDGYREHLAKFSVKKMVDHFEEIAASVAVKQIYKKAGGPAL